MQTIFIKDLPRLVQTGIISAAIVANEMRRLTEAAQTKTLADTSASIPALTLEPVADCSRYDSLRNVLGLVSQNYFLKSIPRNLPFRVGDGRPIMPSVWKWLAKTVRSV